MAELLRVARLYFVLLAIVAVGRLLLGAFHVPYARGTQVFSVVILTLFASLFYGAFCRRWHDYRLIQAVALGVLMGAASQLAILVLTVASYGLGVSTYFVHPTALGATDAVPFERALVVRLGGLVGNSIFAGIVAALGWALGALLPEP
jgi:hypothetical protein